jgi:hypothetical protein
MRRGSQRRTRGWITHFVDRAGRRLPEVTALLPTRREASDESLSQRLRNAPLRFPITAGRALEGTHFVARRWGLCVRASMSLTRCFPTKGPDCETGPQTTCRSG